MKQFVLKAKKKRWPGTGACTAAWRRLLVGGVLLIASGAALAQSAATYPARPVRIVAGFPAGGPVDTLARALAEKLAQSMGQSFIVENIAGATGMIGTERVAKAAPDGHTLLVGASTIPIHASLIKALPYDTLRDLTPIAYIGDSPLLLVVHPAVPATTVRELIAWVKANPGKHSYGSAGTGSGNHLAGEWMKRLAGIDITHVPYKGAAPAEADVMGGHVAYIFDAFTTGLPLVKAGRLRALAVTTETRSPVAPEIPTMIESGLPGFSVPTWYGLIGPGNLPPEIVGRLNQEVARALAQPDLQARLASMGLQPRPQSAARFAGFMKDEVEKWAKVIRDSGAQAE